MDEEIIPRVEIKHKPGELFYSVMLYDKRDKNPPSFHTKYAYVPGKWWAHWLANRWLSKGEKHSLPDEVEVVLPNTEDDEN